MKMKKFFTKAAALFLSAVCALSLLPATAFAATGDVGTVTFAYTYDANGNTMYYNSGAEINGYTAGGVGNPKYRMYVDGDTAFCIQPGVPLHTGDQLTVNSSETWNALSGSQKKAVGLALLYGYQGNRDGLTGSDDEKWLATQTLIWEFVTGCRNTSGSFSQTDTTVYDLHFGSNYPNSGAAAAYDQIVSMLRNHNTVPSFMNGSTAEFEYSNGKYVLTLTDSNNVLSEYTISVSDNSVSIAQSGNTLTITADDVISDSVTITATRNNIPVVSESAKLIAYGSPELQDVVTGVENADPVIAYLNVKTSTGSLKIVKTSEDGVVDGVSFHITGEGIDQTVQTANGGVITLDGLRPGTFTVTEMASDLYEPQDSQTVTVVSGQTATVNFDNILKRGSLKVIKNSEDNLVAGVQFKLSGTSLSGHAVEQFAETDENGVAVFENVLISGDTPYVVEEINTGKQYVLPDAQETVIEWNTESEVTFNNILKKWQVEVFKVDYDLYHGTEQSAIPADRNGYPYGEAQGDATLAGHTYGVFDGETLIDTYVTDENGYFITDYYPCGDNWSIREISAAENGGYLLSDEIYWLNVGCEQYSVELNTEYLDVTERVIIGKLSMIKHADEGSTQIETPEVGAEFEVYLKSSGCYEDAKESERDYLICDENGFAETKWLPYGTYVVHQVSGKEGAELLPDFEVFISEDGRTYHYLANNAVFESRIKIVKTDAESGNIIPCANVGFELYTPEGEQITMT
ncbi:MAG: Cys-Gln thioester bond-forming surface protein, partial [Oscillospiraceae bacterium]|nr:Cys-Gln thioester bond-forming surface protein [Oscillospiraceae bacterium]